MNNKHAKIFNKIARYLQEIGEDNVICLPVNSEEIESAQRKLSLKFDSLYKSIISHYGALGIEAYDIHGLRKLPLMDKDTWSVVDKTKFYKEVQKWPGIEDWYIISDDGRGNPIGVDPAGKVWLSDHDSNFEKVKLADNFEEFLEKLLNDSLYE